MRTLLLCLVGIALTIQSFDATAQVNLGAGYFHGTDQAEGGFSANAQFFIDKNLVFAPEMLFFMRSHFEPDNGFQDWFELNLNLQHMFHTKHIKPYWFVGINFAYVNYQREEFDMSETKVYPALNAGVGFNVDIGKRLMPYGEARLVGLNETDGLIFGGGLRWKLKE